MASTPVFRSCRLVALAGALLLTAMLSACGGSGGGGGVAPPADAPVLSLTPQAVKTLRFTWDDVEGETEYRLLEDPDGGSGYTEIASLAADSEVHDHIVFLPARINARYLLQACSAGGCTDSAPVHVAGVLAEAIGYVKASNTGAGDEFGWSVALSADGDTLAVGAPLEDSNATGVNGDGANNDASNSGAVYVFTRAGATWAQQAYVKASNTGANDRFGHSVALSADGDTLAVGAYFEDSNATGVNGDQDNNAASNSGAVYLY
jgi:trimeric autotransporter adhesin